MNSLRKKLPDKPGVYFFTRRQKVLYIGKATSLRDRVRSYFSKDLIEMRGQALVNMLAEATGVRFEEADSVLEALLLEARLIRKYKPRYNVAGKDDKSFNFVVVTKEKFPRVLLVRGKELMDGNGEVEGVLVKSTYGPFTHGLELREAMKLIRRIFPFRDKCEPATISQQKKNKERGELSVQKIYEGRNIIGSEIVAGKPCFNRQIGLCPGVCSGEISAKEYGKIVKNNRLLFEGKKKRIVSQLRREMKTAAREKRYEDAVRFRNQISALEHISDVRLLKRENPLSLPGFRIEAYDIAHLSGTHNVGVMVVMQEGELAKHEYRRFKLRGFSSQTGDDLRNLREILSRRFSHSEWRYPDLVVIDGGEVHRQFSERELKKRGLEIPVISVVKDERHRPKDVLGETKMVKDYYRNALALNAEAHRFAITYHKKLRDIVR